MEWMDMLRNWGNGGQGGTPPQPPAGGPTGMPGGGMGSFLELLRKGPRQAWRDHGQGQGLPPTTPPAPGSYGTPRPAPGPGPRSHPWQDPAQRGDWMNSNLPSYMGGGQFGGGNQGEDQGGMPRPPRSNPMPPMMGGGGQDNPRLPRMGRYG